MKRILFLLLWGGIAVGVKAQDDYEAYRKRMMAEFDAHRTKILNEYESFRQQINADYAEHMRQVWKEYYAFKGEPVPEDKVKPVDPVPFDDKQTEPVIEHEIPVEPVAPPVIEEKPQPQPVEPIEDKPTVAPIYFVTNYCETEIRVRLSDKERFRLTSITPDAVADGWNMLCSDAYGNLLYDCLAYREKLHLCDWAYLCMLGTITDAFLGKDTNESMLLLAWLYCQSGYKMRLGASDRHLEMLVASEHKIYCMPYFDIDGELFYRLRQSEESLRIFDYSFESEDPLSLLVNSDQHLGNHETPLRDLTSKGYPSITAKVSANKNDLLFYETYPTSMLQDNEVTRWALYAEVPLSDEARRRLYPVLNEAIRNCSQEEAANRLLNWVQTAFKYEYDDKVWGHDRAFFAEETLYYPYCDCEDRSILFSRLVRDLLHLDVALVYYPGHLATAVGFTEVVQGDYLALNGKRFVIADPTYINAPVGRTMPKKNNQTAKAIVLKAL